jgi:tRNA threonylcarbamoyladenosine biosynthesis protein TsaB
MRILALEFSSPQRSAAVVDASPKGRPNCLGEAIETGTHRTDALGLVEKALRQSQTDRAQIEYVAVGLGPGSYTGIRLAIALAQGWQLARPVRLLGISSAQSVAALAQAEGLRGPVTVVIDAQRGEVHLASYELGPEVVTEAEPLRLAALPEAAARLQDGAMLMGPEITRWFPSGRTLYPRAATLGLLAAARWNSPSGQSLEPIYLREARFVKAAPPRFPT